jgi:hypothetical protein
MVHIGTILAEVTYVDQTARDANIFLNCLRKECGLCNSMVHLQVAYDILFYWSKCSSYNRYWVGLCEIFIRFHPHNTVSSAPFLRRTPSSYMLCPSSTVHDEEREKILRMWYESRIKCLILLSLQDTL